MKFKIFAASLLALSLGTSVVATTAAQAREFSHGDFGHRDFGGGRHDFGEHRSGFGWGAPLIAGALLGGIAAGSYYHYRDRDYVVAPGYSPDCNSFYVRDINGNFVFDQYGNYLVTRRCW